MTPASDNTPDVASTTAGVDLTQAANPAASAPSPAPDTVFPRGDIAPTDARAWLSDVERVVYAALSCPDFKIVTTTQLLLKEHQTAKRVPKQEKWSPIQQARAHTAQQLHEFLKLGLTPSVIRQLLQIIAGLRAQAAGVTLTA